ncbi:hypothetical protein [Aeromicrobium sp. 179-A 4D2 NHS]|uniref:hypothetical protein n=1 Tax=Aeromicrobium sp. 179-A 4D2 NHS TaxID=3142375 RepID=UPI00399FC381
MAQIKANLPDPATARRRLDRARRRQLRRATRTSARPHVPSSFGMSSAGILRHATELRAVGWRDDEIRAVLVDPRAVAA